MLCLGQDQPVDAAGPLSHDDAELGKMPARRVDDHCPLPNDKLAPAMQHENRLRFGALHGAEAEGHVVLRKKLRRSEVLAFFTNQEPCLVGIESCSGAHYWARELTALGHEVRLIPARYVKPYVKTNKNDAADAAAICEAMARPTQVLCHPSTLVLGDP
jgi:hypothetical protein